MSDPVTNVEIEDVLSSIRRLVSEDTKTTAPKAAAPQKLLLTPADRVQDDPAPTPEVKETPAALQPEPPVAETQEEEPVAEAPMIDVPDMDASLEDTIAELEAAVSVTPDAEWEQDGGDDDVPGVTSFAAWRAGRAASIASVEEVAVDEVDDDDAILSETIVDPDTVEDAEILTQDETPDVIAEEVEAGIAAAAVNATQAATNAVADETADAIAGSADTTLLDEDSLRELVRSTVQQELQGVLGERITRNVRKLVRREINRALAARELD